MGKLCLYLMGNMECVKLPDFYTKDHLVVSYCVAGGLHGLLCRRSTSCHLLTFYLEGSVVGERFPEDRCRTPELLSQERLS